MRKTTNGSLPHLIVFFVFAIVVGLIASETIDRPGKPKEDRLAEDKQYHVKYVETTSEGTYIIVADSVDARPVASNLYRFVHLPANAQIIGESCAPCGLIVQETSSAFQYTFFEIELGPP